MTRALIAAASFLLLVAPPSGAQRGMTNARWIAEKDSLVRWIARIHDYKVVGDSDAAGMRLLERDLRPLVGEFRAKGFDERGRFSPTTLLHEGPEEDLLDGIQYRSTDR